MLTRDETNALIAQAQAGSIDARNRLVTENMGLIMQPLIRVCRAHRRETESFLSYAVETFIRCIGKFKPEKGFAFSTYCVNSIYRSVRDVLLEDSTIRVPVASQSTKAGRYRVDVKRSRHIRSLTRSGLSDPASAKAFAAIEARDTIEHAMQVLQTQQRLFMLQHMNGKTFAQIAENHGCTKQRVEQVISNARDRILERMPWLLS